MHQDENTPDHSKLSTERGTGPTPPPLPETPQHTNSKPKAVLPQKEPSDGWTLVVPIVLIIVGSGFLYAMPQTKADLKRKLAEISGITFSSKKKAPVDKSGVKKSRTLAKKDKPTYFSTEELSKKAPLLAKKDTDLVASEEDVDFVRPFDDEDDDQDLLTVTNDFVNFSEEKSKDNAGVILVPKEVQPKAALQDEVEKFDATADELEEAIAQELEEEFLGEGGLTEEELKVIAKTEAIDFIRNMNITGVVQREENSKLMADGRIYKIGDLVNESLDLRWVRIDPKKHRIYFQNPYKTTFSKKY